MSGNSTLYFIEIVLDVIHSRRTTYHRHIAKILDTTNSRDTTLHVARTSKSILTRSIINQIFNNMFKSYKHQVSFFVFLHTKSSCPLLSPSFFIFNSDFHKYSTRQKDNFHINCHRYSFSLRVQGPKIWNNLPLSLRNSLTTSNYRQKL